ncbi:MAG: acetate kinase, partial [Firmicutes bacterium]|nr:acetate kinase [Bacillota bacterium]
MKVLVINCGSSSLKYQVLDMTNEVLECKGLVERIGMDGSVITHEKIGMDKFKLATPMENHKDAIGHVLDAIQDADHGVVKDMSEIGAVGHRVVHAGEKFASSVLITDEVIAALEECVDLAPLHNPPNLLGIAACQELMPGTPMVGVFDTAFHQTMP